jgi:hypothetical protein
MESANLLGIIKNHKQNQFLKPRHIDKNMEICGLVDIDGKINSEIFNS